MTISSQTVASVAVPRLRMPAADTFNALAEQGSQPVVLTGCLEQWPLAGELRRAERPEAQIAVLGGLVGRRKVRYTRIAPEEHGQLGYRADGQGTNFTFNSGGRVTFLEFGDALRATLSGGSGGAVYMQSAPLTGFPELLPHVPDLPYLAGGAEGYRQLWIGSGGHVVNLHFDPTHNLIAMLSGQKRVTLVPPENMGGMYPAPLDCRLGDAIGSQVKLLQPDFGRHPRAAAELAKAQVADIGPGDVLYIPPMWWHHVESFGLNVMLNKWILPVSGAHFTDLTINVVRGLLAFDGVPAQTRRAYRDFYHAVLFGDRHEPVPAVDDPSAASWLPRVTRHVKETRRALRGVPPALRRSLPQLYDYYVFQLDAPAALSNTDPDGFKRKLKLYSSVVGALRTVQSAFSRSR